MKTEDILKDTSAYFLLEQVGKSSIAVSSLPYAHMRKTEMPQQATVVAWNLGGGDCLCLSLSLNDMISGTGVLKRVRKRIKTAVILLGGM